MATCLEVLNLFVGLEELKMREVPVSGIAGYYNRHFKVVSNLILPFSLDPSHDLERAYHLLAPNTPVD